MACILASAICLSAGMQQPVAVTGSAFYDLGTNYKLIFTGLAFTAAGASLGCAALFGLPDFKHRERRGFAVEPSNSEGPAA